MCKVSVWKKAQTPKSAPNTKLSSSKVLTLSLTLRSINEPRNDKTNKMSVHPAKTQISLGVRPVWSESSLSAWRNLGPLATHWAHSEDSDQTGRMPRLIWVFAGHALILFVLSCRGSTLISVIITDTIIPVLYLVSSLLYILNSKSNCALLL